MKTLEDPMHAGAVRLRMLALTPEDCAVWGIMNVTQMVCHLREAFCLVLSSGPVQHVKLAIPAAAAKYIALRSPLPWPRGLPTLPQFKVGGACMRVTGFAEDHAGLPEAFDRFCACPSLTKDHPFFTTMTHVDWMRWGYLHADHHLRQFGR
jgi:hypothetical protein